MAKNHRSVLRLFLPTAHKILLKRITGPKLKALGGSALVIGAGYEPYNELMPNVSNLICTDIDPNAKVDQIVDAHHLPYCDSSFDSIVAIEVIEHLKIPRTAISEIYRTLKPGGKTLISIPFMFHIHGDPYDFQRFTKAGLFELFNEFDSIEVYSYGNRLHVISDILTTSRKWSVVFRIFNHFIALWSKASADSPSGYVIEAYK